MLEYHQLTINRPLVAKIGSVSLPLMPAFMYLVRINRHRHRKLSAPDPPLMAHRTYAHRETKQRPKLQACGFIPNGSLYPKPDNFETLYPLFDWPSHSKTGPPVLAARLPGSWSCAVVQSGVGASVISVSTIYQTPEVTEG